MVLDLIQKELFSYQNGSFGNNAIIFGADMSSSTHSTNSK